VAQSFADMILTYLIVETELASSCCTHSSSDGIAPGVGESKFPHSFWLEWWGMTDYFQGTRQIIIWPEIIFYCSLNSETARLETTKGRAS
jgi:hypothetical protein